jgi:TonB family protein
VQDAALANGTIESIKVNGIPDDEQAQLLAKLPIHVGDTLTPESDAAARNALHDFDSHLNMSSLRRNGSGFQVTIGLSGPQLGGLVTTSFAPRQTTSAAGARIGGAAMAGKLIRKVDPEYPPLAKAARVQGTVKFEAVINKDGTVQNLELISGPPLLVAASMAAVRQWIYQPATVNGQPTEVITTIDVNFTLTPQ